ncbi:MAG TPA: hypothetical protein VFA03_12535 [Acetobacteraceae bacterium]|nr:hypothetical protein [Acetobacteraceae bacterium]
MLGLIRGFLPFIVFAVLAGRVSTAASLWVSTAAACVVVLQGLRRGERPKLLELASAAMFALLAAYVGFVAPATPLLAARMVVEWGLAAIAVGSILVGVPFTIQYAREQTPQAVWSHPGFIAVNRRITGVWALAFIVQGSVSLAALLVPAVPLALPVAVNLAVLASAVLFTVRAARRAQARAAAARSSTLPA